MATHSGGATASGTAASVDSTDSSSITTKYGDSDLTSKRRKSSPNHSEFDEYSNFAKEAPDSTLNSTFVGGDHDYRGGLVSDVQLCAKPLPFVAKTPSGTSCGFENTFCILEKQIRARSSNKYLRRISEEYVPSLTSFAPERHQSRTTTTASGGDETPSFFELELEALQRVKHHQSKIDLLSRLNEILPSSASSSSGSASTSVINKESSSASSSKNNPQPVTSPINELLYGFNPKGLDNSPSVEGTSAVIADQSGDYPEYVYHVARGQGGKMYLKVVRSLLLDKVLCGNRVSQMTRAYDDIEAVTRLLEEKEKDLELTVQIGKELLTQNNRLENRVAELEAELKTSNEDRAQLVHDLHQKNELIAILTNDVDDGSENGTPTVSKSINLDLLQKKIASLQDENKSLKLEASQLAKQTDEVEEQERKLMEDITTQLNSTNCQFDGLNYELERQKEENRLQHEQIVSLTARLADAEMRLHQLTAENDEQISLLSITKENQNMLATELAEFKARYQEVLALLQEAQEQMRKQRKKTQPQARSSFIPGLVGIPQHDSLQSELMETSLYSENSLDSGISADRMSGGVAGPAPPYKKVFETVRCATKNGHYSDGMSHLGAMSMSSSSQPRMSAIPYLPASGGSYHRPSSVYSGSTYPSYDSSSMGMKTMSCESLNSQSDDGYPSQPTGMPGAPGAKDLEAALKRLTPGEVLARRAMLSHAPIGTYTYEDNQQGMPLGIRTPDSIMSTGSSGLSNLSSNQWRLPEKLQIVKPMEGSQTLHHWSRLATPTLSGLLEERPGVTIRGGRGLEELGMQVYSLSDVEEDMDDYPGKQFQASGCVYTYTNSTVMHPDDGTLTLSLPQSQMSSCMASTSTSRQPSCPPTPRAGMSRRNSCSTFSVNMGLASMLNERGIKAVTPSALNTPAGPNFSPTVTPCNSPEGSPTRSMSPEPLFGLLSSGADLIRRKLIGETVERPSARTPTKQQKIMLSRLEKRALRSLRLLEKVESVGLENIIATQPNAMSQLASGIASRSASPMAQLTSLKNLQHQQHLASAGVTSAAAGLDDVQFNREQIRAVLSKGLSNDLSECDTLSTISSSSGASSNSSLSTAASKPKSSSSLAQESSMPSNQLNESTTAQTGVGSANDAAPSSTLTLSDIRLKHMQRQKSRRSLKNGIGGQRPDLGTVAGSGRVRPDLGQVNNASSTKSKTSHTTNAKLQQQTNQKPEEKSLTQSFVGSISSLFFGRKGGLL